MFVIKRDGRTVEFNKEKIRRAVLRAFAQVDGQESEYARLKAANISDYVEQYCCENHIDHIDIEEIQNMIENGLMATKRKDVARAYITYRNDRTAARGNITDKTFIEFLSGKNEYWNNENSNKDAKIVTVQRDYIAGIASTDIARRFLLPKDVCEAHDLGIIHEHDMDYMAQSALSNCCLINLEDMLQNGTVINGVKIDPQKRLSTATTVATQIIAAVASSQYGGTTITLAHLAPFVRKSYEYYKREVESEFQEIGFLYSDADIESVAKKRLNKEIKDSVQTFNYQVNSMSTTNGQAPFITVSMWIDEDPEYSEEIAMLTEEFLRQRIVGLKNEKGVFITQAFPKLIYILSEDNIHEDSKYWYLTKLSAQCTAKRFVPDYISEKKMREYKISQKTGTHDCYPCMGCRSFLTPDRTTKNYAKALNYKDNQSKYYGRFNCGVVTINLPDVAFSSHGNFEEFWKILDERCELCHRGLKVKVDRLDRVTSDIAPIMWQHGALARLGKGERLHDIIYHGYATVSLGYAGLYECVKYMTGHSHSDEGIGEEFGLKVMQFLNDKCAQWKQEEDLDYSVYGTPIESTTYKFAKSLKQRFPEEWEKISGKNYITNSYHINVQEHINIFDKLRIESKFQKLSPGGAISYGECADLTGNVEAVLEVIKFIYDNIIYAELNIKSDYCQKCGYTGEMKIADDMTWYCPNCGNKDQNTMNIARRTCGYIGAHYWNYGRTEEIKERYVHLGSDDN